MSSSKVTNLFFHLCDELERRQSKYVPPSTNSWLVELDGMTNSLQPGMLTAIAAHPGMGVTSLALTIAKNTAIEGKKVVYISLTAEPMELTLRLTSALSGVVLEKLQSGNLDKGDWMHISKADEIITKMNLHIAKYSAQSSLFMETLYEECRRFKPFDLLILDDAGLVENVQNMWRDLKTLAKVLSVAVIAIPKILTIGRRVILEDSIYQEADSVVFLNDNGYFIPDKYAELMITKSKSGEGVIHLKPNRVLATFTDLQNDKPQT